MIDLKQKEILKKLVEEEGYNIYSEEINAKESLKELCKAAEEVVEVKSSLIIKMIKTYYKASLEEDKAKFDEFDELYREVMGNK